MHLFDCYISRQQHRWMAAAAAATGESCGNACAADKQQQEKQRPPSPLAASVSATGSPGRVAQSSGSAWPCRVRYPSKERCRANAADQYAKVGLDTDRPLLCDEAAAEDDCRPGSGSRMLPWRHPAKGGEHNRKGGEGLCNVNEMAFSDPNH